MEKYIVTCMAVAGIKRVYNCGEIVDATMVRDIKKRVQGGYVKPYNEPTVSTDVVAEVKAADPVAEVVKEEDATEVPAEQPKTINLGKSKRERGS